MSRSYKHSPVFCGHVTGHHLKPLARRRERHTALDTIGYLSNQDGDPLLSRSKRRFTRLYSSWEIHDGEYLWFRGCEERWLELITRDEQSAVLWLGEDWRSIPRKRYMYQAWARACYWK